MPMGCWGWLLSWADTKQPNTDCAHYSTGTAHKLVLGITLALNFPSFRMSTDARYSAAGTAERPSGQGYVSALIKKYKEKRDRNMLLWITLPTHDDITRVDDRLREKVKRASSIGLSERPAKQSVGGRLLLRYEQVGTVPQVHVAICLSTTGTPEPTADEMRIIRNFAVPLSEFVVDVFTADADSE